MFLHPIVNENKIETGNTTETTATNSNNIRNQTNSIERSQNDGFVWMGLHVLFWQSGLSPFFSSTVFVFLKLSHLFQVSNTHSLPKFMDGCKFVNSNFSLILWVLISFNQFLTLSHSLSFSRRESLIGEWHEVINLTEYLLNEHLPTYNYFGKLMKWKLEICVLMKCTLFLCRVAFLH